MLRIEFVTNRKTIHFFRCKNRNLDMLPVLQTTSLELVWTQLRLKDLKKKKFKQEQKKSYIVIPDF